MLSNDAGVQIDKRKKNVECTDNQSFFVKNMCDLSVPYNTTKFYFQLISSEIIEQFRRNTKKNTPGRRQPFSKIKSTYTVMDSEPISALLT